MKIKLFDFEIDSEEYIISGTCEFCFYYDDVDKIVLHFKDGLGNTKAFEPKVVEQYVEGDDAYSDEYYQVNELTYTGGSYYDERLNAFALIKYIEDNAHRIRSLDDEVLAQDVMMLKDEFAKLNKEQS